MDDQDINTLSMELEIQIRRLMAELTEMLIARKREMIVYAAKNKSMKSFLQEILLQVREKERIDRGERGQ